MAGFIHGVDQGSLTMMMGTSTILSMLAVDTPEEPRKAIQSVCAFILDRLQTLRDTSLAKVREDPEAVDEVVKDLFSKPKGGSNG